MVSHFLDHLEILQDYEQNAFGYYIAVLCVQLGLGEFSPASLSQRAQLKLEELTKIALNLFRKYFKWKMELNSADNQSTQITSHSGN